MLCRSCHCQLTRGAPVCDRCGTPVRGASPPLELVLPDERRIALTGELDAGRASACAIVIDDPSVSRRHAIFVADGTGSHGLRPRLRSGYALKRLERSEGSERYVLSDMRGGGFARLDEDEASLLELLDGRFELPELVAEAERLQGPGGPGLLARLVADL